MSTNTTPIPLVNRLSQTQLTNPTLSTSLQQLIAKTLATTTSKLVYYAPPHSNNSHDGTDHSYTTNNQLPLQSVYNADIITHSLTYLYNNYPQVGSSIMSQPQHHHHHQQQQQQQVIILLHIILKICTNFIPNKMHLLKNNTNSLISSSASTIITTQIKMIPPHPPGASQTPSRPLSTAWMIVAR